MAGIRTRKRGNSYSYIFEAGRDEDGRRKVVEKGGFKSETEAMDAGMDAYISWKHGDIGITSEKITLTDFIKQYVEMRRDDLSPTYRATLVSHANNNIIPYLGKMSVQDINPLAVNKWLSLLVKRKLAKKTIMTIRAMFHAIMEYAIFPSQLINNNPVVRMPLPKNVPDNVNPHVVILPEHFMEIVGKLGEFTPAGIVAMLQYHCGLRIGEALGMTWDRIDMQECTMRIDRQITGVQHRFSQPKTLSSIRTIIIPPTLMKYLVRLKQYQLESRMRSGTKYYNAYADSEGFVAYSKRGIPQGTVLIQPVVMTQQGKISSYGSIQGRFKRAGFSSHSLRHSHATLLVEGNASLKDISARLGHANTSTTMNIYTHDTPAMQKQTVDIFENVLQNNLAKNVPCRQNADN
jgi:integrase